MSDEQPKSDSTRSPSEVAVDVGTPEESAAIELPEILPVLPLKNTVLFPFLLSPLLVNSERSKKVIDQVLVTPERLMVAPAVRHANQRTPGPDDI